MALKVEVQELPTVIDMKEILFHYSEKQRLGSVFPQQINLPLI